MNRQQITFFVAGLIAGLICITLVSFGPPEVAIMTLTTGVGPLFFVAVVAGIVISGAWHHFRPGLLRYLGGLVLCTTSYFAAAVVFWWVGGLSSQLLGFRSSDGIGQFGFDIWLGLIAAGVVGAIGIALFATLLTRRWSNALLRRLLLAGLLTICVTFIVNLPFQKDGSFLGVLFPLGNALFCYFVGAHIWQHSEGQVAATMREPRHR
jgi:hypothetical protein